MEITYTSNAVKHYHHSPKAKKKTSLADISSEEDPSTKKTKEFFQSILNKINSLPTGGSLSTQEVSKINAQLKTLDASCQKETVKPILISIRNASNPDRVSYATTQRLLQAARDGLHTLS